MRALVSSRRSDQLGLATAEDQGTMRRMNASSLARSCAFAVLAACSAGTGPDGDGAGAAGSTGGESSQGGAGFGGSNFEGGAGTGGGASDCVEEAELVYLVSVENSLYSFDPTLPGTSAYHYIGDLTCNSIGSPQSMSVDKSGVAWVFYDSGELFRVSTTDASCTATSYVHPVQNGFNQLGMGFTATSEGEFADTLYVVSPDFGLATIAFPSLAVTQLGGLVGAAELTGGPDAKLFHFAADNAVLSEVNVGALSTSSMHTFNGLQGTTAWAFSRYAGKFYMFTWDGFSTGSTCTVFDPNDGSESVRDFDIGFTVVGAGQSICVPPPVPQ